MTPFQDLKNNKSVFQQLQKKLEEGARVGTVDERFWKITPDKAGNGFAIIRFLPTAEGEDMPFVRLYSHAFQGPGGWYIENSLTTLGKEDPVSNYNRELWNSGDESLKDQVRKQSRKTYFYSNIYVVKDPANPENEGKVFLFRYGRSIHSKIQEAVNGNELEGTAGINPFDLWSGADFKLRTKKKAGYPTYEDSSFSESSTLGGFEDAELEAIWNKQYKLNPLVADENFKSFDQLQERLNVSLNLKGGQRVEKITSEEAREERAKADPVARMNMQPQETPVTVGVSLDEGAGDNASTDSVMEYFKDLVNN